MYEAFAETVDDPRAAAEESPVYNALATATAVAVDSTATELL